MSFQEIDILNLTRQKTGTPPDLSGPIRTTPREVPGVVKTLGFAGIGIGVLAFAGGLATDAQRTWGVVLTCIVYFVGLSFGGPMFSVIQTITLGRWGRPLKRVAESFGSFIPFAVGAWFLYLMGVLGGFIQVYPWLHEEMPPHKAIYFQPAFFVGRQLVLMTILSLLAFAFLQNSLRADLGVMQKKLGVKAPAWWGRLTSGWKGDDEEAEAAYQRGIKLGPVMAVSYMLIYSVFAVDAVMSLNPHWYANMFPVWQAVSNVWMSLSWIVIFSVLGRQWLGLEKLATPKVYHDLGKLMFAFCMFWAYNFFAQLLPIWYGNMPEETGYLLLRLYMEPWKYLSWVVGSMCFFIPFTVLLSRGIKKSPYSLVVVAFIIVTGIFLERFLLVMPEIHRKDTLPIGPVEIGVLLGFVGAFVSVVTRYLAQIPSTPINDPFLYTNPFEVHVHRTGDHGHGHGGHGGHGGDHGGHDDGHAHA